MDVSVSEIVVFLRSERLTFKGIVLMHRQILVAVEEVYGANQHSNKEPNFWRSVIVQLVFVVLFWRRFAPARCASYTSL